MTVGCPHCGHVSAVDPSQAGSILACPNCGGKFQVPIPTAQNEVQIFTNKKIAAGICGIIFGGLGIHKFILGFNTAGAIMLGVYLCGAFLGACLVFPLLAPIAMQVIGVVEGILYLTKSDQEFYQSYSVERREWF